MRISGFTIARNAIKLGYPIEESIQSLLPLVDEMVVAVGDSEDRTWEVVTGIGDPKIVAFRTVWDLSKQSGGAVLADQTNIALERCTGDWALYLQTDELLHEAELETIRTRMARHLRQGTDGLSFSYFHFYGSYQTVQDNWCRWYRREVRAVRTGRDIVSVGDAAGFKINRGGRLQRLVRADSGAHVYHYGWTRSPSVMSVKHQTVRRLYLAEGEEQGLPELERIDAANPYRHLGHLAEFGGSHPALMRKLIAAQDWKFDPRIPEQPPRWLRYLRLLAACPKDSLRIFISRVLLTWNTYIPAPKLR